MNMTAKIVQSGTGCSTATADSWLAPLQAACDKFGIASPNAIACFLANIGVESAGLTVFAENLNYSAQGLANTWPARYATNPRGKPYVPNPLAVSLARRPQAIANNVYAGRLGNGDAGSDDGWRYRGQGPIQLSGHDELAQCGAAIGMDLLLQPATLQQPAAGSMSAAWYFSANGCIAAANAGNFALVVKIINGAYPDDANSGPLREARRKAALAAIAPSASGAPLPA